MRATQMAREILTGNSQLLVAIDRDYAIRELYYPLIGQTNHLSQSGIKFIVGADKNFSTIDSNNWRIKAHYLKETLCSSVSLSNNKLQLILKCYDTADFHLPVLIRKVSVRNLADHQRTITIYAKQNFELHNQGLATHKTFDQQHRLAVHYAGWLYATTAFLNENSESIAKRCYFVTPDELSEMLNNEDTENVSYIKTDISLGGFQEGELYFIVIVTESLKQAFEYLEEIKRHSAAQLIERSCAYWRLWTTGTNINFGNLPARVVDGFKRSLLTIRMHTNENGSIITDIDFDKGGRASQGFMRTMSAAITAHAFDLAGLPEPARWFYSAIASGMKRCKKVLPRYNPDCSPAEICDAEHQPKFSRITDSAILLWGLWRHYFRFRDIEYIRSLWPNLIKPLADSLVENLKPPTYLPPAEPDIKRHHKQEAITLFASCLAHSAMIASRNFAICFGEGQSAEKYLTTADNLKKSIETHFFSDKLNRFVAAIYPLDNDKFEHDTTIDSDMLALVKFGTFPPDDPRVIATMTAISDELWVKTPTGGLTQFTGDFPENIDIKYNSAGVPGWPAFISTLWLGQFLIAKATNIAELKYALPIFEWAMTNASSSGLLADKLEPLQKDSNRRYPYVLSHAEFIITVINYLEKLERLKVCESCGQGIYRMRRHWPMQVKLSDILEKYSEPQKLPEHLDNLIVFEHQGQEATFAIDLRECIGCSVCTISCPNNVLIMTGDKVQVDMNNVHNCNVCRECEQACPVNAISISLSPAVSQI